MLMEKPRDIGGLPDVFFVEHKSMVKNGGSKNECMFTVGVDKNHQLESR